MNISRRAWPKGETYAGFFRSKTHGPVRIEIRHGRDPYPTAAPAPLVAGFFPVTTGTVIKGPSPQHKAECDCAEFHGGKCQWPACEGSMYRELVPPGGPAFFGLFDIASGRAIRDRLTRKRST